MKKGIRRWGLPRWGRLAGAAVCVLALCLCVIEAVRVLPGRKTVQDVFGYGYSVTAEGSAVSLLADNDIYPDGKILMGQLCPYALTTAVTAEVSAAYHGTQEVSGLAGRYQTEVVVAGALESDTGSIPVYEKHFPLQSGDIPTEGSGAAVTVRLALDPAVYIAAADAAATTLGTNPTRSVTLVFSGRFTARTDWGEVDEPFSWTLLLPSSRTTPLYTLTASAPTSVQRSLTTRQESRQSPAPAAAAGVIAAAFLSGGGLWIFLKLTRPLTPEETFRALRRHLLRLYGGRMVCLAERPAISPETEWLVKNLQQLAFLAEEQHLPVFYTADEEGLPRDGFFFVPCGGWIYTTAVYPPGEETTPKEVEEMGLEEQKEGTVRGI